MLMPVFSIGNYLGNDKPEKSHLSIISGVDVIRFDAIIPNSLLEWFSMFLKGNPNTVIIETN